ncbi:hypothetical protein BVI434_3920008 [Burkholderia vietnamiensis]|nr:hypothetical protein BVI1335_1230050 [Burkholderia vietnamiensis]CAG9221422.1 hypothetical protein BVI434_3920008 [Burkholderia vietnamiensis]
MWFLDGHLADGPACGGAAGAGAGAWLRRECRALKQEPCQGRADTVRAGPLGAIDLYQKGKIGAGAGAAAAHAGWAGSHGASGWPAKLAMA